MSKKYYWQHEDTGRVCETSVNVRPSHRWYSISKKAYRAHEAQANNCVQADGATATPRVEFTFPGDRIYSDSATGATPRRRTRKPLGLP